MPPVPNWNVFGCCGDNVASGVPFGLSSPEYRRCNAAPPISEKFKVFP
jgi:hypothetical protein